MECKSQESTVKMQKCVAVNSQTVENRQSISWLHAQSQLWPHSQYMCDPIHCPYQEICGDWQALSIVMMVYIRLWVSYCFMIHWLQNLADLLINYVLGTSKENTYIPIPIPPLLPEGSLLITEHPRRDIGFMVEAECRTHSEPPLLHQYLHFE